MNSSVLISVTKKSEDGDSYKFYELFPEEKQDIHVYCSFSLYL